jgi:hypothetical protein
MARRSGWLAAVICAGGLALPAASASAQFIDRFDGPVVHSGWAAITGDGLATMELRQGDGFASLVVDGTKDRANIWWALIKRDIASSLDVARLSQPGHELRLQARVRLSHAPRRVHFQANTQRTTNFHEFLMEFDIPDTDWHTISWTTRNFQARPGDAVNIQFAITDWGLGTYHADIDDFRADVVEAGRSEPDLGVQTPYHPPVPDPRTFSEQVRVARDATVSLQFPELSFERWHGVDEGQEVPVLTVDPAQIVLLAWDFSAYAGRRAKGAGLLELTTQAVQAMTLADPDEYGQVRVTEITGGDTAWDEGKVTLERLLQGRPLDEVVNPQMIIDERPAPARGARTFVTISRPVLQRLLDGRTRGLAIRALGPIDASFYAREFKAGTCSARLLFDVEKEP